jgi:hypothetical protein
MVGAVPALRRLLLALVLAGTAMMLSASSAAAVFDGYFNCTLQPVGAWCTGQANGTYDGLHSWDFHEGWYPGPWDNSVTACQRLYKPSTSSTLTGSSCTPNYASNVYGTQTCICLRAEVRQYSGGLHSINGHAVAY